MSLTMIVKIDKTDSWNFPHMFALGLKLNTMKKLMISLNLMNLLHTNTSVVSNEQTDML